MMFSLAAIGAALRRIPGWVYVLFLLVAAGLYYGHARYNAGQTNIQAKWDAQKAKDAAEIAKLKAKAREVTVKVETKYVDRIQTVRVKGDTIIQKVPVYVPRDLPELPPAFRWLHDHAAQGTVPGPAESPDGSPVAPADVAGTVAANYTTCLATAEQLKGLQEWINEQRRLNP
jgi:hypothetical protein